MERHAAFSLLDLPEHASEADIHLQAERRRTELEERLAKAPTMALKAKYRTEIARVGEALEVLAAGITGSELDDLPVGRKLDIEETPQEAPTQRGGPPPVPGVRKAPPPVPSLDDDAEDEEERYFDDDDGPPPPRRPPLSRARFWTIVGIVTLALVGLGFAIWQFGYRPAQRTKGMELAKSILQSVASDASSLPVEGELVHGKIRALCNLAIAAGSIDPASGTTYLSEAMALLSPLPAGHSKDEDYCRILAAQAACGNTQAAVAGLVGLQKERNAVRAGQQGLPSRIPVQEDLASRTIAIAMARSGQPEQALSLIEGISPNNDPFACEALCEVALRYLGTGDKAQAMQTLQTLETKAKRVADPLRRAPLLLFVAERMNEMLGSTKAKQWVSDALGGSAVGGGTSSGYMDYEARKVISQAILLPAQLRVAGEAKDSYRKKVEDVSALTANLQSTIGSLTGTPDYQNRATAYSHIAVAWHELAQRWFAGDAAERAADAVAKALQSAAQVRSPVQLENDEATVDKREEALTAAVAALSVMGDFEQAKRIAQGLTMAENQGPAFEVIAHHMGRAGQREEAEAFVRSLPAGEPRLRAAVGLSYGIRSLPMERWW